MINWERSFKTRICGSIYCSLNQMLNLVFNSGKLNRCIEYKTALALITVVLLIAAACGKRRPPLPPVERVSQRVEISGVQKGSEILISWVMPSRNAADGSILNIDRVDIYRLAEPAAGSLSLSEEEFISRSTLIATEPVTEADFAKKRLTFTDKLNFAGQNARLRYAVRFVNKSGQKAAFSNFLLIEPSARIADNPTKLTARAAQEAVRLEWTAPATNVDGSTPPNILGYNLYRSASGGEDFKLLNAAPLTSTSFSDDSFQFEQTFRYLVRAVSLGTDGEPVESLESNIAEIRPKDVFPPQAPTAITVAAAPNSISLFFATNIEKDIAGYRIYRSVDPQLPRDQWLLLTPELLKTNTFQDKQVKSGVTYYYYLTAVDVFGNVSNASETVSETLQ